jgi:hypothetical protein
MSKANRYPQEVREGFGFFRPGGALPQTAVMVAFIDPHRMQRYGVEPMSVARRPLNDGVSLKGHHENKRERS